MAQFKLDQKWHTHVYGTVQIKPNMCTLRYYIVLAQNAPGSLYRDTVHIEPLLAQYAPGSL